MKTIKEVSKEMNLSEHTLRFWAKEGLFPYVERDKNNIRQFSQDDLQWVMIVKCLRSGGVQLTDIKKYLALCQIGDSTIEERFGIIMSAKQKTLEQIEELKKQLAKLDYKEKYYKELMKNHQKDACNPMNKMMDIHKTECKKV